MLNQPTLFDSMLHIFKFSTFKSSCCKWGGHLIGMSYIRANKVSLEKCKIKKSCRDSVLFKLLTTSTYVDLESLCGTVCIHLIICRQRIMRLTRDLD